MKDEDFPWAFVYQRARGSLELNAPGLFANQIKIFTSRSSESQRNFHGFEDIEDSLIVLW